MLRTDSCELVKCKLYMRAGEVQVTRASYARISEVITTSSCTARCNVCDLSPSNACDLQTGGLQTGEVRAEELRAPCCDISM
ncbi:hypothetical protein GOBAR_DD32252 [Gossypium barbadense]|nr:hypothetical protein GOBAR_DD32252 [Gossypium barbadense]